MALHTRDMGLGLTSTRFGCVKFWNLGNLAPEKCLINTIVYLRKAFQKAMVWLVFQISVSKVPFHVVNYIPVSQRAISFNHHAARICPALFVPHCHPQPSPSVIKDEHSLSFPTKGLVVVEGVIRAKRWFENSMAFQIWKPVALTSVVVWIHLIKEYLELPLNGFSFNTFSE